MSGAAAAGGVGRSKWTDQMRRIILDIVDKNLIPEKEFTEASAKDLRLKLLPQIEDAFSRLPANERTNVNKDRIKDKLRVFTRSTVDGIEPKNFLIHGSDLVDFSSDFNRSLLSDSQYATWRAKREEAQREDQRQQEVQKNLERNTTAHSSSEARRGGTNTSTRKTRNEQAAEGHVSDSRGRPSFLTAQVPVNVVKKGLAEIHNQIIETVRDRLLDSERAGSEPVLHMQIPYSADWDKLFRTITGAEPPLFEPGLSNMKRLSRNQSLPLDCFMRSVIGASVFQSVLASDLLQDKLGPGYDKLIALIRKGDTPSMSLYHANLRTDDAVWADWYAEETRKQLLRETVTPLIPREAALLASRVDVALESYAAPPRGKIVPRYQAPVAGAIVAQRGFQELQNNSVGETSVSTHSYVEDGRDGRKRMKIREPRWSRSWRQELEDIFVKALELKASLEEKPGAQYRFDFPTPCQPWTIVRGSKYVTYPVLIGLFPRVEVRYQDQRGGDWTDWKLVDQGAAEVVESEGVVTGTASDAREDDRGVQQYEIASSTDADLSEAHNDVTGDFQN